MQSQRDDTATWILSVEEKDFSREITVLLIPLRFLGMESFEQTSTLVTLVIRKPHGKRDFLLLHIEVWAERKSKTNFMRISYEDVKFLSTPT
jgi:hypothetical protein